MDLRRGVSKMGGSKMELRREIEDLLKKRGLIDEDEYGFNKEDRLIIEMKGAGILNKNIAAVIGVSESAFNYRINKIVRMFSEYGLSNEEIAEKLDMVVVGDRVVSKNKRRSKA